MDGWGKEIDPKRSAIAQAKTPFVDSLYSTRPYSMLTTFGEAVGLPEGQMGNSEVGHMNLGAGRVVYQELQRINQAISSGDLEKNEVLIAAFQRAKEKGSALHLMGLVSDGGVHSHINHLIALCRYADRFGLEKVFIHCFTDGRDCDPKSAYSFIENLLAAIAGTKIKIASVVGRYYAMDRDKRWERVKKAYELLVNGVGVPTRKVLEAIQSSYDKNISDEFIEPIVLCDENNKAIGQIKDGDEVLCFNFRTDRCREITEVLSQSDMHEFNMHKLNLGYTTMTKYDEKFEGVAVIFEKDNLKNTLGEVLALEGRSQLRIAETEKYPHVSFFFSGGREVAFIGEDRIMIPSPKVATYDLQPEMSAVGVMNRAMDYVEQHQPDFVCLNFANTDMVGHTGDFAAAMKAAETVDSCVEELSTFLLKWDYDILLTADHGNADVMINEDGSPNTAHSTNLVPLFYLSNSDRYTQLKDGKLGDIAPTILKLMRISLPPQMTGNVLL
ncbi:MAG: 2,3-bisphosphoglycerate-independent phosphoglycerate mutase [Chitinophagales bacterium]|nr:2,3-bisphosphoglycerate-independent phosphoglycerate mutase [Bacteroidota bacterium]MCB9255891.1 2,3-bisphosphoglycerate-independent phosphoglycerate mutase [Chitinophagales bacterium]